MFRHPHYQVLSVTAAVNGQKVTLWDGIRSLRKRVTSQTVSSQTSSVDS